MGCGIMVVPNDVGAKVTTTGMNPDQLEDRTRSEVGAAVPLYLAGEDVIDEIGKKGFWMFVVTTVVKENFCASVH